MVDGSLTSFTWVPSIERWVIRSYGKRRTLTLSPTDARDAAEGQRKLF